jgi:hypothetical protein
MAFIGTANSPGVRECADGWWAVRQGTSQYRSWWLWMHVQFGHATRLGWMTTLGEWPPMTILGAQRVAQVISDIRDEIDREGKSHYRCAHVPRHPEPWDGVVPSDTVWKSYGWTVHDQP